MLFARWTLLAGALAVVGGFGALIAFGLVRPSVARAVRAAAAGLVIASLLLIGAQLQRWFGMAGFTDPEHLATMLTLTLWGRHWTWLVGASVTSALLLSAVLRWPALWPVGAPVAAALTVLVVPLVGHGSTAEGLTAVWHRLHLAGAGLWIGTLAVVTLGSLDDLPALATTLRRFAPVAFTGATLVAVSGTALSWSHLSQLSMLWTTEYGGVLAAKIAAVLVAGMSGFVNWRRPRVRAIALELIVAFGVVLALTAWLSDLEPPAMRH